jgi:hypothetical protein
MFWNISLQNGILFLIILNIAQTQGITHSSGAKL